MGTVLYEREMIEINLDAPNTPEERQMHLAGNLSLGKGAESMPYADNVDDVTDVDDIMQARQQRLTGWAQTTSDNSKPQVRFFAVGPKSYQIYCPLCNQRADTETVQMSGILGQLSCLLSTLSCCFPIFWLSFVYCCLQSRLKSKRLFCNRCGGHLGFYMRPT